MIIQMAFVPYDQPPTPPAAALAIPDVFVSKSAYFPRVVSWNVEQWYGKRSGLTLYRLHGYDARGKCVHSTSLYGEALTAYLASIQPVEKVA